jgi:hypothetical protein
VVECTRLESEQTVTGLGSSNLPLSASSSVLGTLGTEDTSARFATKVERMLQPGSAGRTLKE